MFFLDSEINTLTLNQLKNYLRRYNQNVTGKKAELTLRAKGVSKLVKADVICGKAPTSQFERRHTEKLVNPRGEKLPAPFSLVNGGLPISRVAPLDQLLPLSLGSSG